MKICMILHDPQEFGGLEEYATTLAVSLQQRGQDVSVLSTTWVAWDNQYVRRLVENGIAYVQVPKYLSLLASNWTTKQSLLRVVLWLATPLIFLLAVGLFVFRRKHWSEAWKSAHGWLRGHIQTRIIGPNWYKPLSLFLLNWWRFR